MYVGVIELGPGQFQWYSYRRGVITHGRAATKSLAWLAMNAWLSFGGN